MNKGTERWIMKKGDIWIGVVLLGVLAWFIVPFLAKEETSGASASAVITVNGEHYRTVELTESAHEIEIETSRGYNLLRISHNGIEMIEADCPDQLCLGFGHVHRKGGTIVCLPNRIFVEIIGADGNGDDVDAVVF